MTSEVSADGGTGVAVGEISVSVGGAGVSVGGIAMAVGSAAGASQAANSVAISRMAQTAIHSSLVCGFSVNIFVSREAQLTTSRSTRKMPSDVPVAFGDDERL